MKNERPETSDRDPESEEIHTRHEGSFDARELEAIESRSQISPPAIFETIRREGLEELSRPASALILSAFVAGIALGFSVLTKALLRQHLPDESWRPLVENLGYSVGFLIVILGQLQLFTENTITAVAPAIDAPSRRLFGALLRLWALVLIFNLVGAALFGWILWAEAVWKHPFMVGFREQRGDGDGGFHRWHRPGAGHAFSRAA